MKKRTIWALVSGAIFVIVVTTLVDIVLHGVHVFPPMDSPINGTQALLATAYRIAIGIAGAWLTARLAPNQPMKCAMLLGYIGTGMSLVGVVTTWNMGLGPHWYPIVLVVLAIPQSWIGARIYLRHLEQ